MPGVADQQGRGGFGPASPMHAMELPATLVPACKSSDALPTPLRAIDHDLADNVRDRVGLDDVLNRVSPIVGMRSFEAAGGAKGALTGCGPEREISHARQLLGAQLRQHVQAMRGRIEEGASG